MVTKRTWVEPNFLARLWMVAVLFVFGCTEPLPAKLPGTGGVKGIGGALGTGGRLGTGGVASTGGVNATTKTVGSGGMLATGGILGTGGSPGSNGGASGTDACAKLTYDYCVKTCFEDYALSDNATCANGAWTCRSGYILASSCSAQACGVTPDACCDSTTGDLAQNACKANGYREACPSGNRATYWIEASCIPDSLVPKYLNDCMSLDKQTCAGPAVGCRDLETGYGIVTCGCSGAGADGSIGTWHCSAFLGP